MKSLLACLIAALGVVPLARSEEPAVLYARHCASCHGPDRWGRLGPALLPESLERLRAPQIAAVIRDGRPATQMPSFAGTLAEEDFAALATWLLRPAAEPPQWDEEHIRASREAQPPRPLARPIHEADPRNLFVVVEQGDHHLSVLDGDRFTVLARLPTHFAVHGGPKFSPDGRFVYTASRDGWVEKFDLWALERVAQVRVGINARNLAVSADGRFVAVANYLPHTLVILDADLEPVKILTATSRDGKTESRVSAVYDATPRRSFVVALKDLPQLWEVSYDEHAAPVYDGLVHDYRMAEALGRPGFLHPRRVDLDLVLDDFFFDPSYRRVLGASRDGRAQVIDLDVGRPVAELALDGMPHLGSGVVFERQGRTLMASTNLQRPVLSVIDLDDWHTVAEVPLCGQGFFVRTHENSRYAFVDGMMTKECRDGIQVLDKETLQIVATLRPEAGKTFAHVEFTRDGRHALASVMEPAPDGALWVIDTQTLQLVRRIPMNKPIGKYNVANKLERSGGTSH